MNDANPPPSWYDPPEPILEIKWEQKNSGGFCSREGCSEEIYMDVEIGHVRHPNGHFVQVCRGHYESIFEDTIDEWNQQELIDE